MRDGYESEIDVIQPSRRGTIRSLIDRVQFESDFGSSTFAISRIDLDDDGQVLPDTRSATGNSIPEHEPAKKPAERTSLPFARTYAS